MLISNRVAFSRVILRTAKTLIYLVPACVATYFLDEYLLRHKFNFPFIIPAVLGPAMAFFIGFNNNQAYDRWWEARKIWGGLVNTSRTYARQILQYSGTESKLGA